MKTSHLQRGIIAAIYLYGLAAVAIIAGLYGAYQYVNHHWETSAGISRGKEIKQAEWTEANRQAQAQAQADKDERFRLAAAQSAKLASAEGRARDADARWRAARSAAARAKVPLVVADCAAVADSPGQAGAVAGTAPVVAGSGITLRLTWTLVRLWDSSWTGETGQSVFGNSAGIAEEATGSGSASPYTIESALDNFSENASRCSANSRQLINLIQFIEKLRSQ